MTVGRVKSFPFPERVDSIESIETYLKKLYRSLTEEQIEKITDFENMDINSLQVTDLSLTGELDITKSTTLLIDLNPGFTGTGEVINITPSDALASVDAEWDGINIVGNALSPGSGATGAFIHGIHIDFSSVDTTYLPAIDGLHIEMPTILGTERLHAIHANQGAYFAMDLDPMIAGAVSTTVDVVYDTAGATGGCIHGLDVARVGGGTVCTVAVGTHTGVDVIHQHIGTATAFDKVWEYDVSGTSWIDVTTACGSADTDVALWDAQNDVVYFGQSTTFDEIECIWATAATKSMHFTFWYSTGESTYTQFYPADDTNGAQINGLIRWLASDIGSWATGTVNTTETKYWIKVIRTRLVGTAPTEDTVKFIKGTTYGWDKTGAITALGIEVPTYEATTSINLRSNAELRFYDNGNYVGFEAPALGADCIWVLPTADGAAGEHMVSDGSKTLSWTTGAGTGNVVASGDFATDNVILRSDGVGKGCQHTGITIDDSDNIDMGTGGLEDVGSIGFNDAYHYIGIPPASPMVIGAFHGVSIQNYTGIAALIGTPSTSLNSIFYGNLTLAGNITLTNGDIYVPNHSTSAGAAQAGLNVSTGLLYRSIAGNRKYKDKIKDLELDTSSMYDLRPISFTSKCKDDDKKKRYHGFIADEVVQIYPSIVEYNKENEPDEIDYRAIQMVMLKEIQNLRQELDKLKESK